MPSVTQVIKKIKQPIGGYVPMTILEAIQLETLDELKPEENIHPSLVGLAVDYLTRFALEGDVFNAFRVSIAGARFMLQEDRGRELALEIQGLDEASIKAAVHLVAYDSAARAGNLAYRPTPDPDRDTILNIRLMVERSLAFLKVYGPVTVYGFDFKPTGKYDIYGDGDFATKDTLWDFKVSKNPPTTKQTLQVLLYYLLGVYNNNYSRLFNEFKYIGIYNPRHNKIYRAPIEYIPKENLRSVLHYVL